MEARRWEQTDAAELKAFRRGWCFGSEEFKQKMLAMMSGKLGENHSGELRRESAAAKAERIILEELERLGWQEQDLVNRRKSAPEKLALAARLRRETTLSIKWIAARVHLGTSRSAHVRLHEWMRAHKPQPLQPELGV
jgi:hypothetical protein